jgi:hypothetical protein
MSQCYEEPEPRADEPSPAEEGPPVERAPDATAGEKPRGHAADRLRDLLEGRFPGGPPSVADPHLDQDTDKEHGEQPPQQNS